MSLKQRVSTDQLINIIQVIQLGRKTGYLWVERGNDEAKEIGEIHFVQGQISFARCGDLYGQQAFQWLQNWGPCRFTFETVYQEQHTDPMVQLSPLRPHHPLETSPISGPLRHPSGPLLHAHSDPNNVSIPQQISLHPNLRPQSKILSEYGMKYITEASLSRTHMRLYLLINGTRTIAEIAQLMRRQPEDLYPLLVDLERLGLIRLS